MIKLLLIVAASVLVIKWLLSLIYSSPALREIYYKMMEPVMKY